MSNPSDPWFVQDPGKQYVDSYLRSPERITTMLTDSVESDLWRRMLGENAPFVPLSYWQRRIRRLQWRIKGWREGLALRLAPWLDVDA